MFTLNISASMERLKEIGKGGTTHTIGGVDQCNVVTSRSSTVVSS